ncbi:MAG: response regulator [Saprospiraceae bacterium]|nr:response regulator [Saprospiraceae bacterium]|tara:strand:- start:958 stop:2019 length:1062 start_codon:yes stop_codon:yes gene_type:complete
MKKILVIEDNLEVRENICEILELDGYNVIDAENGKRGIQIAKDNSPDLILCDVMMPELDGFGVLKILSKNDLTKNIPFIFLTAKAENTDFRKGMGLGADDYITKPFDDTQLLEAIEMRLKKSEDHLSHSAKNDRGIQQFFSEVKAQKDFEKLIEDKEIRTFNDKNEIYKEGSESRWLYFINSGSVKRFRTNEFGKELITHIYKEGDYFGYFSILQDMPHLDSAVALNDATLHLIPADDFKMMLFNNRDFIAQFVRVLSEVVEDNEQKLLEMAYSSVRRKVANALLDFSSLGKKDENDQSISLSVSRENLAAAAGTAKETLIRTLSDFKAEGLLQIQGKNIIITDKVSLESMPQ